MRELGETAQAAASAQGRLRRGLDDSAAGLARVARAQRRANSEGLSGLRIFDALGDLLGNVANLLRNFGVDVGGTFGRVLGGLSAVQGIGNTLSRLAPAGVSAFAAGNVGGGFFSESNLLGIPSLINTARSLPGLLSGGPGSLLRGVSNIGLSLGIGGMAGLTLPLGTSSIAAAGVGPAAGGAIPIAGISSLIPAIAIAAIPLILGGFGVFGKT